MVGDGRVVASENFEDQALHGVGIKGMIESKHFIQNAPQTPDV